MRDLITVKDLKKDINNGETNLTILKGINLTIREKEYVAIMGPSGSGKSTLMGIMSGLDDPTSGMVSINGTDISKLSDSKLTEFRNENMGIVFQSFNLIPALNAIENIEMPMLFSKKNFNIRKKSKELMRLVGLEHKTKTFPRQLSGGEQQRVAIARALAVQPKILFADEPTGALDSRNSENVIDMFKKLRDMYGMAIVMVTHDRHIAEQADRVLYIEDGVLSEMGGI